MDVRIQGIPKMERRLRVWFCNGSSNNSQNCFGKFRRETGHSLVPLPPLKITGIIACLRVLKVTQISLSCHVVLMESVIYNSEELWLLNTLDKSRFSVGFLEAQGHCT